MLKRGLILFGIFFILTLVQTNFFIHFEISGQIPNLVLIFLFLTVFFTPIALKIQPEAILAGFFLDIFSYRPMGISMLVFFLGTFLIQEILKNLKKTNLLVFLVLFLLFQCFYYFLLSASDYVFEKSAFLTIDRFFLIRTTYNLVLAIIGFGFYTYVWFKRT